MIDDQEVLDAIDWSLEGIANCTVISRPCAACAHAVERIRKHLKILPTSTTVTTTPEVKAEA